MRRRSLIRRLAKWTGVVVCVVLVAAWVFSFWRRAYCYWGPIYADLDCGYLWLEHLRFWATPPYFDTSSPSEFTLWWPGYRPRVAIIPIWLPLAANAIPTAYVFYRNRRPPRGHCQGCGYDLKGNVSGVCPECGRAV